MKYRLKKDLPGYKKGEIFHDLYERNEILFTESLMEKHPDWFEPIPERIELKYYVTSCNIEKVSGSLFTTSEIKKMEAAINNECWSEDEIEKYYMEWVINYIPGKFNEYLKKQK